MRAWVYRKSGNPTEVLKLEQDYAFSNVSHLPIKIRVKSASLNPVGYKAIKEIPSIVTRKPAVPEQDFAGIVEECGPESGFKPGDEVFGMNSATEQIKNGIGCLAEFTNTSSAVLVKKPSNISFAQAASIPLAGLTAYTVLIKQGDIKAGSRVLVNGSSGGVGVMAVQIAKAVGAYVVATCSEQSSSMVKDLGADETVDYRQSDFLESLARSYGSEDTRFDLVFDAIGVHTLYKASPSFVKSTGSFLTISAPADNLSATVKTVFQMGSSLLQPKWLGGTPVPFKMCWLEAEKETESLARMAKWLEEGTIKPVIDSEYSFEEVPKAYERIMSGRAKGKVIVNVR